MGDLTRKTSRAMTAETEEYVEFGKGKKPAPFEVHLNIGQGGSWKRFKIVCGSR